MTSTENDRTMCGKVNNGRLYCSLFIHETKMWYVKRKYSNPSDFYCKGLKIAELEPCRFTLELR